MSRLPLTSVKFAEPTVKQTQVCLIITIKNNVRMSTQYPKSNCLVILHIHIKVFFHFSKDNKLNWWMPKLHFLYGDKVCFKCEWYTVLPLFFIILSNDDVAWSQTSWHCTLKIPSLKKAHEHKIKIKKPPKENKLQSTTLEEKMLLFFNIFFNWKSCRKKV